MATAIDPTKLVQGVNVTDDDLRIQCPTSILVAGPSQSGKSHFLLNLVQYRESIFSVNFARIIYCQSNVHSDKNRDMFAQIQAIFPHAEQWQGIPILEELHLNTNNVHTLLLIDDLMDEIVGSFRMNNLAVKDVHNYKITAVFVFQNYFSRGKWGNNLVKNCQYKIIFYNRCEMLELRTISSHLFDAPKFLKHNFEILEKIFPADRNYYILIDTHAGSKAKKLFCRSKIFPDNKGEFKPVIFFINPNY